MKIHYLESLLAQLFLVYDAMQELWPIIIFYLAMFPHASFEPFFLATSHYRIAIHCHAYQSIHGYCKFGHRSKHCPPHKFTRFHFQRHSIQKLFTSVKVFVDHSQIVGYRERPLIHRQRTPQRLHRQFGRIVQPS